MNISRNFNYNTPSAQAVFADESLLWSRFKNGDESAFIKIYKTYYKVLYNYCLQFDMSKEAIEDNIQDFFIQLREKHKNLSDTDNIKAYLLKSIRRRMYSSKTKQNFYVEYGEHSNISIVPSAEEELIRDQRVESIKNQINKSLGKLSSKQREVIYYFYFEDMSYAAIQNILGYSSPKIVRNLLYKAINSLRKTDMTISSFGLLAVLLTYLSTI